MGRADRLEVRKPGKLIARARIGPKYLASGRKPYWQNLYRVRVYGPVDDIKLIRANLRAEYGRLLGLADASSLRKLGWSPIGGFLNE